MFPSRARLALLLAALSSLAGAASAQSLWHVDVNAPPGGDGSAASPYSSLQVALDAGATLSGDSLHVAPGTYVEFIDFRGKNVRVAASHGPQLTVLRGDPNAVPTRSVVTFASGEGPGAQLIGFTIRDGNGRADAAGSRGGGVYIEGASPTLRELIVRDNTADFGGGVFVRSARPSIASCAFYDNVAAHSGGALRMELTDFLNAPYGLEGCRFARNVALNGDGGAVSSHDSFAALNGSSFQSNAAPNGSGGAANFFGLGGGCLDCVFTGNSARSGGALALTLTLDSSLMRCEFRQNHATNTVASGGGGGAVLALASPLRVSDSSFIANRVEWPHSGGAIRATGPMLSNDAHLLLLRCEFTGNARSAIYYLPGTSTAVGLAQQCTIVGNDGGVSASTPLFRVSSCIVRDNGPFNLSAWGGVTYSNVSGGAPGAGNIDVDPQFWNPAALDWRLAPSSPCIDSGDPALLDPDGSRADMGARPYSASDCLGPVAYCLGGTSSDGACSPTLELVGAPSVQVASGCVLRASGLPGARMGGVVLGLVGEQHRPWGSTSFSCVAPPRIRSAAQLASSSSGACDGSFEVDLFAWLAAHGLSLAPGTIAWAQAWYRDPAAARGSNFSSALRFGLCP